MEKITFRISMALMLKNWIPKFYHYITFNQDRLPQATKYQHSSKKILASLRFLTDEWDRIRYLLMLAWVQMTENMSTCKKIPKESEVCNWGWNKETDANCILYTVNSWHCYKYEDSAIYNRTMNEKKSKCLKSGIFACAATQRNIVCSYNRICI